MDRLNMAWGPGQNEPFLLDSAPPETKEEEEEEERIPFFIL